MVKNFVLLATIVALFAGAATAKTDATRHPSSQSKSVHHKPSKHHRARKGAWKRHGQQQIDTARATEIQQALIREKYLDGEATGKWDTRTEAAMARYQAANGWQSKVTPDSRALIKLGLGPNHQNDLQTLDTRSSADTIPSTGSSSNSSGTVSKPR